MTIEVTESERHIIQLALEGDLEGQGEWHGTENFDQELNDETRALLERIKAAEIS